MSSGLLCMTRLIRLALAPLGMAPPSSGTHVATSIVNKSTRPGTRTTTRESIHRLSMVQIGAT